MIKRNLIATLTAIAALTLIRKGIRKLSETNENKPKFNVDDYVKITGQPTIYRIDHVEVVAEHTVYHLEGTPETSLYTDDVLEAVDYINTDDVDLGEYIIPLFDVGETVQINGSDEVYNVIAGWPEMVYGLQEVETQEYIEMDEYALKEYVEEDENKSSSLGKLTVNINLSEVLEMAKESGSERKLTPREESSREAERRKQARKQKAADIDNLLDIANWNRRKYEETGDEAFAEKEREQYAKIKEIMEGAKTNE